MTDREFKILWEKQNRLLIGYAYNRLREREECKDVVAEAFTALWNEEKEIEQPLFYLQKVIHNKCLDRIKHLRRAKNVHEILLESSQEYIEALDIKTDLTDLIVNEIKSAPPAQRKIMELKYEGYDNREIAEILGLSMDTIRTQLFRFRNRVKPLLS